MKYSIEAEGGYAEEVMTKNNKLNTSNRESDTKNEQN
jgi:hypothetical protein